MLINYVQSYYLMDFQSSLNIFHPSRNNFTERVPSSDPAADYGTIAYYSLILLFVAIIIMVGLIVMIPLEPIPSDDLTGDMEGLNCEKPHDSVADSKSTPSNI